MRRYSSWIWKWEEFLLIKYFLEFLCKCVRIKRNLQISACLQPWLCRSKSSADIMPTHPVEGGEKRFKKTKWGILVVANLRLLSQIWPQDWFPGQLYAAAAATPLFYTANIACKKKKKTKNGIKRREQSFSQTERTMPLWQRFCRKFSMKWSIP